MQTSGDSGQAPTSSAQPNPSPNESSSAVSWASAFQSPEFMLGLQSAVSQALRQYTALTDRVTQLESLRNPTQTATISQARTEGQVGNSVPRQSSGTFVALLFINSRSSATLVFQGISSVNNALGGSNSNELASQIPSVPSQNCSLESAFILGPGRAPIPAKMIKRILQHEFVEMSELMHENVEEPQTESPVFTFVGSLVAPKPNSAIKNTVTDILTWAECFNSYIAMLTTFHPLRSRDLLAYMALIVWTAKRFVGTAWLDYDRPRSRR